MAKGRNEAGPEVVAGHLLGAAPPAQQGEKGGPKVSPKGKGWSVVVKLSAVIIAN